MLAHLRKTGWAGDQTNRGHACVHGLYQTVRDFGVRHQGNVGGANALIGQINTRWRLGGSADTNQNYIGLQKMFGTLAIIKGHGIINRRDPVQIGFINDILLPWLTCRVGTAKVFKGLHDWRQQCYRCNRVLFAGRINQITDFGIHDRIDNQIHFAKLVDHRVCPINAANKRMNDDFHGHSGELAGDSLGRCRNRLAGCVR